MLGLVDGEVIADRRRPAATVAATLLDRMLGRRRRAGHAGARRRRAGRRWPTRLERARRPATGPFVEVAGVRRRPAALPAAGRRRVVTDTGHAAGRGVVGPKAGQGAGRRRSACTTVGDLLRHYPRRYAERGELTDLASLQLGERGHRAGPGAARSTVRPMRAAPRHARRGHRQRRLAGTLDADLLRQARPGASGELRPSAGAGLFAGTVDRVPAASGSSPTPTTVLLDAGRARPTSRGVRRRADPGLPGRPQAVPTWQIATLRADWRWTRWTPPADPLPADAARAGASWSDLADRAARDPPPGRPGRRWTRPGTG